MFHRNVKFTARMTAPFVLFLALAVSPERAWGKRPPKLDTGGVHLKELLDERLAVVREMAKLSKEANKALGGSYDEMREATRMVLRAELELCDSDKDRIAVLEKFVVEAKETEKQAAQIVKTGQAPVRTALKAQADRLQAEIALERVRAKPATSIAIPKLPFGALPAVQLAERQVAIKLAMVKIAEARQKIAMAKLATLKAMILEAQATISFAEKQVKRFEELANANAVPAKLVDEHRAHFDAAKAGRTAAESKVAEGEAQVSLEAARVELAKLEVEEAELRLKQLK